MAGSWVVALDSRGVPLREARTVRVRGLLAGVYWPIHWASEPG